MNISKTFGYLSLIFLLALVLRFVAASYVDVGTDEMIYSIIPLNIISAGRLGTVEQSPLYFYLADIGYTIGGGLGPTTARLPSIIFGSVAVFLVYLISMEMFASKKAAYLSSFFWALSGYALQYDSEMDMAAFFFALLSMFLFLRSLKTESKKCLYLSAVSFGLAVMIKNIVLLFVPAYLLIYWLSKGKEKALSKPWLKTVMISILLFLAVLLPIFAYNYLTYTYSKEGVTDYYVAMLGIGKVVHGDSGGKAWAFSRLLQVTENIFREMLRWETLTVVFGFLGMILCFRKSEWKQRREVFLLLAVPFLFLLTYLGGKTGSSTHFLWIPLMFSIFAGYGLVYTHKKMVHKFHFKYILPLLLIAAIVINIIFVHGLVDRNKSASTVPLWKFAHQNIPEEAIVIIDPRIYGSVNAWAFNDRHYLEGRYLQELLDELEKSAEPKEGLPLYYLECGKDGHYCGWKPEDFERIKGSGEQISAFLVPSMQKVADMKTSTHFVLYSGSIDAPRRVYDSVDRTHQFWFYPVGWHGGPAIDDYTAKDVGVLLNMLSFLVLYVDLILSLLAIPFVFYVVNNQKEKITTQENKQGFVF